MAIAVGDRVRMSRAFRERTGFDMANFYRGEDGALLPLNFTGTVLRLYERTVQRTMTITYQERRAAVGHAPENCGCDLHGSGSSCPRCEGTGVATIRFFRVEDLERVDGA